MTERNRPIDALRAERQTPYEEYTDGECPLCKSEIPVDAKYGDLCQCGHVFNEDTAGGERFEP